MSRPDLDALLTALVNAAQELLAKHGEFIPFGATMTSAGEVELAASYLDREHPSSDDAAAVLEAGFRQRAAASELRAAALCRDVRVRPPGAAEKTDAIEVRLEHRDGEAVVVFLPYRKTLLRRLRYGELFAVEGTPTLFPAPAARGA